MALTKEDLQAIEDLISLSFAEKFEEYDRYLAARLGVLQSALSAVDKKFDAGIAAFESNLESLRDSLSG